MGCVCGGLLLQGGVACFRCQKLHPCLAKLLGTEPPAFLCLVARWGAQETGDQAPGDGTGDKSQPPDARRRTDLVASDKTAPES
jgi:hypothetical protein